MSRASVPRSTFEQLRSRCGGQALAEFALVLPVLLFTLLFSVDAGRVFFGWVNLQNIARIGANFAAEHASAWGTQPNAAAQSEYQQQMAADASSIDCTLPTSGSFPSPTFLPGSGTSLGQAEVSVACSFTVITPRILGINTIQLGATSIFPVKSGALPVPSPTSTPTPTPTPAPTPTPTAMCTVPALMGTPVDNAASAWLAAGFTVTNINISLGSGNYTIESELGGNEGQTLVPGSFDGTSQNCATFILTVGPQS